MAGPYVVRPARPTGVTILIILQIIGGIGDILLGVVLLLAYAILSVLIGGGLLGTVFLVLGMVAFGLGLGSFVIAYGLWSGKRWAWVLGLIGAFIGLILGVFGLIFGGLTPESLTNLVPIILYGLILVYSNTSNVRAFLGRASSIQTGKANFVVPVSCEQCGWQNSPASTYCGNCAAELREKTHIY